MKNQLKGAISPYFRKESVSEFIPINETIDRVQEMKIVSEIREEFLERKTDRKAFEMQWQLNINFREGRQFLEISPTGDRLQEIPRFLSFESRQVFNQIAPIIETRLAKLQRLGLEPDVRSATGEDDDISKAKITSKILKGTKRKQNFDKIQKRANEISENYGTVIFKPFWNPKMGRKLFKDENGWVREGDIETVAVSPHEIFPENNYVEDVENQRSIIHVKAYHVKDIYDIWGVETEPATLDAFTLSNGGMPMTSGDINFNKKTSLKNHALVYEYWEKPCKEYPKGRLIICTDDRILHYGNMPYKIKNEEGERGYPFVVQKCVREDGCFWGSSIIQRLIPIQRRYNSIRNRAMEHLYRNAIGVLAVTNDTEDIDILEEEGIAPGQLIVYKRGSAPPQYLKSEQLPSQYESEINHLLDDFIRISGVSEMSRTSTAPTGVSSGRAFAILAEQDDTRISLTADNIKEANLDLYKKFLRFYKQYAKGNRVLRIAGEGEVVDVIEWISDDITSEDVVINTISSLSETPAQKKQFIIDVLSMGLLNDPVTGTLSKDVQLKVLDALEFGDIMTITNDDKLHTKRAERENLLLNKKATEKVQVEDYDNHEEHIRVHINEMLKPEFEKDVLKDNEIKILFNQHILDHTQALRGEVKLNNQLQEAMNEEQILMEQLAEQEQMAIPQQVVQQ